MYLEDKYLNVVLENYFNEADENRVEVYNEKISINESLRDKLNNYNSDKIKKEQEKLLTKFKEAQKKYNYKYYCVKMIVTYKEYTNTPYDADFYLYGSNEKPFTKEDKGFFRTWKKYMKAKKLFHFHTMWITKIENVPNEIKKYIL